MDYLHYLAGVKFPETINIRTYMVRRSLAITRWIRNIQAGFLRNISGNVARCAAYYKFQSHETIDSIISNPKY